MMRRSVSGGVEEMSLKFRALSVYIEGQRLWEIWKNKIKKFAQGYVVGLARASLAHQADFQIIFRRPLTCHIRLARRISTPFSHKIRRIRK
jgi:hypothetical protein